MIGWSAAPTLVERQRENLTERLKREFGLFLNDDDEENVRKQGEQISFISAVQIRKKNKSFLISTEIEDDTWNHDLL